MEASQSSCREQQVSHHPEMYWDLTADRSTATSEFQIFLKHSKMADKTKIQMEMAYTWVYTSTLEHDSMSPDCSIIHNVNVFQLMMYSVSCFPKRIQYYSTLSVCHREDNCFHDYYGSWKASSSLSRITLKEQSVISLTRLVVLHLADILTYECIWPSWATLPSIG